MVRKILSLLLLLCLLIPMTVACGDKESEKESGGESVLVQGDDVPRDDAPTPIMDDFGGYEFRVLSRSGSLASDDITGELGGAKMSNATYRRNVTLKDKYNFEIVEYKEADPKKIAQTTGAAGEYAYDMWAIRMADVPALATEGYLYDLNEVDEINLEASYYDERTIDAVSFAERLFFVTGDMLYMDDLAISCMVFNTKLWNDLQLDNVYQKSLYQLVESGEWTFEALKKLAISGIKDLNGDGVYDSTDQWGCAYANGDIFAMTVALGDPVLQKDADDIFYLNKTDKLVTDLTDIFTFFNSPSCIKDLTYMNGTVLFKYLPMNNLANVVSPGSVPYGVIPAPKYDETAEYYSYVSGHSANCITICSAVPDVDKTANIIELISYESQTTNVPVFAEYLFSDVYAHEDDVKMVEILKETRAYENAYVWSIGSIYNTLIELNQAGGMGIAHTLQVCESSVNSSVKTKLKAIRALDY